MKDLMSSKDSLLVSEGQSLDISKDTKGGVTIKVWNKERETQAQENRQSHEGVAR
jgi:hypothetical protein